MASSKSSVLVDYLLLVFFWLYVLIPLGWGIGSTLQKALALFQ